MCLLVVILCIVGVVTGLFTMLINNTVKGAIEVVGTAVLGVKTTVSSVSLALISARSDINGISVSTVPGYGTEDFLDLSHCVFDLRLMSLFLKPYELQEISVHNLAISIDQSQSGSNAQRIIDHVTLVTEQAKRQADSISGAISPAPAPSADASAPAPAPLFPQPTPADTLHAVTSKIIANKLSFKNISARICLHPLCDAMAPMTFTLKEVLVQDVGKQQGGVYMYELIEILVQALVIAVIHAAPEQIGTNLMSVMNSGLSKALNYASLNIDTGAGLEQVGAWTGAQLDMLGNATSWAGQALGKVIGTGTDLAEGALEKALGNASGQFGSELKEALRNQTQGMGIGGSLEHAIDNMTSVLGDEFHGWGHEANGVISGVGKQMANTVVNKAHNAVVEAPVSDTEGPTAPPALPVASPGGLATALGASPGMATALGSAWTAAETGAQAAASTLNTEKSTAETSMGIQKDMAETNLKTEEAAAKAELEETAKEFGTSLLGSITGGLVTPAPAPTGLR